MFGSAQPPFAQVGMQVPVAKTQTWSEAHGSSSSQRPGGVGTQAARQSRVSGEVEVAHASHTVPSVQLAQNSDSQAGAHSPVAKMQSLSAGQSWCAAQTAVPLADEAGPDPVDAPTVEPLPVEPLPVDRAPEVPDPGPAVLEVGPEAPWPVVASEPPAPPAPPSSSNTVVPPQAALARNRVRAPRVGIRGVIGRR